MMNLLVLDFLREYPASYLSDHHGVDVKRSRDGFKASIDYNQISAKDNDPLACQCRGLVVKRASGEPISMTEPMDDIVVIARPFDRFFNHGTACAANIDFSDPETVFEEKVDGTCAIVYFDGDRWCMATRSVPDADQSITVLGERTPWTFRGLFEKAVGTDMDTFAEKHNLRRDCTYVFELCTPMNPVVVLYEGFNITLLGVRVTLTGEELDPRDPNVNHSLPTVQQYRFGDVNELIAFVASRSPKDAEGIIVKSRLHHGRFDRVKVKSPAYMAGNQIGQRVLQSPRAVMSLILSGFYDDVAPQLNPFVREKADAIKDGVASFYHHQDSRATAILMANKDRKSVALAVQADKALNMTYIMGRFLGRFDSFYGYVQSTKNADGEYPDAILDLLINGAAEFA